MGASLVGLDMERKMLTAAIKARRPALCIGETGTGKTSLARELGEAMCPAGVWRVNLNGGTTPDELEGRFQLKGSETYFQYGVLVEAMQRGGMLLLDELNAALADTLFVIHALLEDPARLYIPETKEEFRPHPDFCVVATMNPSHEYAGTRGLNMALYSRFAVVVRFNQVQGDSLAKVILSHYPMAPMDTVTRIVDVIDQLGALRRDEKLTTPIGVREALSAIQFATDGLSIKEALVASIANKLDPSERKVAGEIKMLQLPAKTKWRTVGELVTLANDCEAARKAQQETEKKMERYAKLVEALKQVGLSTPEEAAEALKARGSS